MMQDDSQQKTKQNYTKQKKHCGQNNCNNSASPSLKMEHISGALGVCGHFYFTDKRGVCPYRLKYCVAYPENQVHTLQQMNPNE